MEYDFTVIEKKWQEHWEKKGTYRVDIAKTQNPFYNLVMFPYPSGYALHLGHWYNYSGVDVYGRFMRLQGYDVFQPMGYDAFGLPAENFAIKTGTPPAKSIAQNTATMEKQIRTIGGIFQWENQINTSTPEYYQWTQWLFLHMYKKGLAEKRMSPVNWCSGCQTVLANEQVKDGVCERCSTEVVQKDLEQWFWKTTAYSQRLLDGLDTLDWPEQTKHLQRQWIGRSEGATIFFNINDSKEHLEVFTTRPDTIFGVTYMVLAPEHPLVATITTPDTIDAVQAYQTQARLNNEIMRLDVTREKTGAFTGSYAINPANGQKIPIWIADYVLTSYGTGAIMAVPAHDERDCEFALKFNLPIVSVIGSISPEYLCYVKKEWRSDFTQFIQDISPFVREFKQKDENVVLFTIPATTLDAFLKKVSQTSIEGGWIDLIGHDYVVAWEDGSVEHIVLFEDNPAVFARQKELEPSIRSYTSLWDMLFHSRYREVICFTGAGIMQQSAQFDGINNKEGIQKIIQWIENKNIGSRKINYRLRDWLISRQRYWGAPIPIVYCSRCGTVPVPEEQLPVILPESLKEYKPKGKAPLADVPDFINTTCPQCGKAAQRETDTMDTFVCSSWYWLRYLDPQNSKVPFPCDQDLLKKWLPVHLYIGGIEHACMHLLYARFVNMVLFDAGCIPNEEPFKKLRHQGLITKDGAKMSKSKGNVVNPDQFVSKYGADVFRMYLLFMGPFEDGGDFSDCGIIGIKRFLDRVWKLYTEKNYGNQATITPHTLHKTIAGTKEDYAALRFNTAIAKLMECLNEYGQSAITSTEFFKKSFLVMLSPLAPHLTEELWEVSGYADSIHQQQWPQHDPQLLITTEYELVIQVNGKVRAKCIIVKGTSDDEVKKIAVDQEKVQSYIESKEVRKIILVPEKLINIVV